MTSKEIINAIRCIFDDVNKLSRNYRIGDEAFDRLDELEVEIEKLEEIRKTFKVKKEENLNHNRYWLIIDNKILCLITRKQYEKWKRWL